MASESESGSGANAIQGEKAPSQEGALSRPESDASSVHARSPTARLLITSTPPGADVFLKGQVDQFVDGIHVVSTDFFSGSR